MTGFHFVQHEIGKFFGPRPKPLDPCQAQKAVLLFGTEGVAAEEIPSTLSNHSLGSVVDAGGQRRSTRRVRQTPLKQDLFASGHGGGGR